MGEFRVVYGLVLGQLRVKAILNPSLTQKSEANPKLTHN